MVCLPSLCLVGSALTPRSEEKEEIERVKLYYYCIERGLEYTLDCPELFTINSFLEGCAPNCAVDESSRHGRKEPVMSQSSI